MLFRWLLLLPCLLLLPGEARAQGPVKLCFQLPTNPGSCIPVTSADPLPVTSGGGGGGAVTIADGADVTQGAIADAAYAGSGSATVVSVLKGLYAGVTGSVPAGAAIIGKVGIDQTTPGTTNGVALTAGSAVIGNVRIDQTTPGTTNGVQVSAALPAGANVIGRTGIDQTTPGTTNLVAAGQNGTWTVQPGNTANTTPWLVSLQPATSGGLTNYFVQPTASDNHVVIKAGAGQVYRITATNNSATINYLRLYNATTGFNGCNSATNLVYQVLIPANSTNGGGISDSWSEGMAFSTGISACITSGYSQTDTTNATASAISFNVGFK